MDTEILVHIKAPSRVADDKRYISITQGVLGFSPVNATKVTRGYHDDDDVTELLSSPARTKHNSGTSIFRTDGAGAPQPLSNLKRKRSYTEDSTRVSRVSDTFTVSKAPRTRRYIRFPERTNNPPYRNPLHGKPLEDCTSSSPRAKSSHNDQVHSDDIPQVLVPNTERRTRRATRADSCPPEHSKTTVIPNSQPECHARPHRHPSRLPLQALSKLGARQVCGVPAANNESGNARAPAIPKPGSTTSKINSEREEHILVQIRSSSSPPILRKKAQSHEIRTIARTAPSHRTYLRAFSQEKTYSKEVENPATKFYSSRKSNNVMCDGVQTSKLHEDPELPYHGQSDEDVQSSVIGINHDQNDDQGEVNDRSRLHDSTFYTQHSLARRPAVFAKIKKLPLLITGPSPNGSQITALSFDVPVLKATAGGLGLPRHFRPEKMARDVSEKERGYWEIPIIVVTSERAIRDRCLNDRPQLDDQHPSWRPLLKHPSLTEAEFTSVWGELSRYVSSGNAGWSVRVMRRGLSVTYDQNPVNDQARLYLQVFCYGEAIPHIYAMLLVCSRMHVLRKPLQWVSTLDKQVVITMPGEESRKGNLGLWTRKSDKHGNVIWGCDLGPREESLKQSRQTCGRTVDSQF